MSTSETTLPPPPAPDPRRRRRWPLAAWCLLAVVVLGAVLFIVTAIITAPYNELVPGDAQPVSQLITVPAGQAHRLHGKVLLTDVGVETPALPASPSAGMVRPRRHHGAHRTSSPATCPESEFDAQGTVDMAESQLTAKSVALRQLGYSVPEHDVGVTVYVIDPGITGVGPASLQVGDVITAVDGVPTPNPSALVSAARTHQAGRHGDHAGRLHRPPDTRPRRHPPPGSSRGSRTARSSRSSASATRPPASRHGDPARSTTSPSRSTSTATTSAAPRPAWPGPSASSTRSPAVI